MTDDSTPEGTVEQDASVQPEGPDALLDRFLGDEQLTEEQDEPEQASDEEAEAEARADAEAPEDDADTADSEDDAPQEDGDQSQEEEPVAAAGRFVGDDGKVRLADGTVTTVAELKRGSLREADYTQKTQEVSALKNELKTRELELTQQQASYAIDIAQQFMPPEPDPALIQTDAIGYMQQKAAYDAHLGQMQQFRAAKQQAEQALEAQRQQELQQYVQNEQARLGEALPELKDPAKATGFKNRVVKAAERYGFTAQDIDQIYDHRLVLALKDLAEYQRIMADKPKAMAKTQGKPPLSPGRRQNPKADKERSRQQDWQKLRSSGGKDNGALDRILDDLI